MTETSPILIGPHSVLVGRLLRHYDPFPQLFARRPTLAMVQKSPVVNGRVAVPDFEIPSDAWERGRIRYFMALYETGQHVDPIELDWKWGQFAPVSLVLLDGHHRLCAASLVKLTRIPVSYGGPVDFLDYLTGERRSVPRGYS